MGTHVEDNWYSLSLVASSVVNIAVISLLISNNSFTCLPLHGKSMVLGDWKLTNLTSDFISLPVAEGSLMTNGILKVDQGSRNTSINEVHLITRKILNE